MKISFSFKVTIDCNHVKKLQIKKNQRCISLVESVKEESDKAVSRHSYRTAANYATAMRSLLRYLKSSDVDISDVSVDMLKGWQKWLLANNISLNTVSCYMRSIRAILNKVGCETTTIFKKVFTGSTRTTKRSINSDDISRLMSLRLCAGSRICIARDIFLFSFYCQGMPFVDIAFMRKEQLHDGYIVYARHKTGQKVRIAINAHISEIVARYKKNNTQYVFPIITTTDSREAYRQYRIQLGYYNKALRQLGLNANIDIALSSYVARHSWASIAFQNNVDLSVISQAMGHTNTKTTMIYIRELDSARLDEANRIVINSLHREKK